MIFIAKNEAGTPTWKLAKEHRKTVTSRVKQITEGKTFAIQPGRGKPSICRGKVIFCIRRLDHYHLALIQPGFDLFLWRQKEAELEGFLSWDGLMRYFEQHHINFMDLYRIEFVLVEE